MLDLELIHGLGEFLRVLRRAEHFGEVRAGLVHDVFVVPFLGLRGRETVQRQVTKGKGKSTCIFMKREANCKGFEISLKCKCSCFRVSTYSDVRQPPLRSTDELESRPKFSETFTRRKG